MKRMFALLLSLTMVFSLTACGGGNEESSSGGSEASGETITIKLPHCYSEGHPLTDTLENFFKPELESRSGGRLTVDLYPNSTLATEEQIYEGLRNNTYEMGVVGTIFQDRIPSVATFQLPFLFSDFDQAREALYEQDYGQQLIGDVASLGFTVNGIVPDGFRVMTLNRKAESLADLKGLKLRMPNLEVMVKIGECLGCAVTPMAMTEVFSALEQNVIDGQENPPSTIRTQGWYEIQDYLLVSNHRLCLRRCRRAGSHCRHVSDRLGGRMGRKRHRLGRRNGLCRGPGCDCPAGHEEEQRTECGLLR